MRDTYHTHRAELAHRTGRVLLAAILALSVLVVAGAWAVWRFWWRGDDALLPDDPRLTFQTPYRNVRPEVAYVGDQACARCHEDIVNSYQQHPMGRSAGPVAKVLGLERFAADAKNPFDTLGFRYTVERQADRLVHREARLGPQGAIAEMVATVAIALGSGTRGRSYLVNRDGYLFQSPISWYSQRGRWDIAPGYVKDHNPHFERAITPACLFCHTNYAEVVEHTVNRYREPIFRGYSIGCERCHGPGELHVKLREQQDDISGLDDTIVNPRRLEHSLREAVCQQCHLQGEKRIARLGRGVFDYRPGLPLHLFWSIFVRPPEFTDNNRAVGHVEQMSTSRCFRESTGSKKMGCISCHDPHRVPDADERITFYRKRCLSCHQEQSCSLPVAGRLEKVKGDSCYECHMPQVNSSNIAHTAITDHRIPRNISPSPLGGEGQGVRGTPPRQLRPHENPLVHFHRELVEANDHGVGRDLGLALTDLAGPKTAAPLANRALPLLEDSLHRWPSDIPGWEAKGNALFLVGRDEEALSAFETGLKLAPQREGLLVGAAAVAAAMGRLDDSISYLRRAIGVNPHRSEYHSKLAHAYRDRQEWKPCADACQRALQLNPADFETRRVLVECLARLGNKEESVAEFDLLLGFKPEEAEKLRRWFQEFKEAR